MDLSEDVDFDFFDTPRNNVSESPKFTGSYGENGKPPKGSTKHVSDEKNIRKYDSHASEGIGKRKNKETDDIYSSDDSSYSDSETPRVKRAPAKATNGKTPNGIAKSRMMADSPESSSAYSDSESDSVDSYEDVKGNEEKQKTNISVTLPKTAQAWGSEVKSDGRDYVRRGESMDKKSNQSSRKRKENEKEKISDVKTESESESDSSREHYKNKVSRSGGKKHHTRAKTAKEKSEKLQRQPLKSTSSSYSNNSDITDVSPLESPESSPRETRKKYHNVQYKDKMASDPDIDIRLDSDKIDLSILMKCMADIDKEKQQRLKTNSRRVMFAPPSHSERPKTNYSYSASRAQMIEKENQRLLQQIMQHVQPGSKKLRPGTATKPVPKKAVEPVVQRLTPSAVNRQREQRKIEMENMQLLKRLQGVKASKGMSRKDQLHEFERQASYGMPTCIIPSSTGQFDHTMPYREMQSQMSVGQTQRSRPSSAKSNLSTASRRSRPSSAKSNASVRSNASIRSNMSIRSGSSTLRGKKDMRPAWDDRFAYS